MDTWELQGESTADRESMPSPAWTHCPTAGAAHSPRSFQSPRAGDRASQTGLTAEHWPRRQEGAENLQVLVSASLPRSDQRQLPPYKPPFYRHRYTRRQEDAA